MNRFSPVLLTAPFALLGCFQFGDGGPENSSSGGDGDGDAVFGSGGFSAGTGGISGDGDLGTGGFVGQPTTCAPACSAGMQCLSGACVCASGLSSCGSACVDTQSDAQNCGACGTICEAGLVCSLGGCSDTCAFGLTLCGASCVDTQTSLTNCGGCGVSCESGGSCAGGMCMAPPDPDPDPDPDPTGDCSMVTDSCPFSGGLTHVCKTRFSLGINYAWRDFAADFGGLSSWELPGVSENSGAYAADLADMSNRGAQTVRWWMFPDFRGDGVQFDGAGDPTGITNTAVSDIQTAIDLAEAQDVYLVLTIFSFDNFRPTRNEGDVTVRGMSPMVRNSTRRSKLVQNVVRPVAQAVANSQYPQRVLGWDIINEPEWAVNDPGGAPTGGAFTPNEELDAVSLSEMKALINESAAVLKQVTPDVQVSVGWAAAKWAWAFSDVTSVDFHQPHIYGWVNEYWPYTSSPSALRYSGKPTVMGEFYLESMPFSDGTTYNQIVSSWFDNGYAGAWSWQYNENASNLGLTQTFANSKGCSVRY